MAIDFTAYRAFLDSVEAAEASGRKWHTEALLDGEWSRDATSCCGPGEYEYRVIYDSPPEPPAAKPLEGWCNVYQREDGSIGFGNSIYRFEDQAARAAGSNILIRTVRVREVVEEHKLDGLAESVCLQVNDQLRQEVGRLKQVVLNVENALTFGMVEVPIRVVERVQQAIAKHRDATDQLLTGVEAVADVLADPQPDMVGDIRQGVPVPGTRDEAAEYLAAHVKPLRPTLLNRPQSTPNPLAEAAAKVFDPVVEQTGSKSVVCQSCNGRGYRDRFGTTCEVCLGNGEITVLNCSDQPEPAVDVVIDDPAVIEAVEREVERQRPPEPRKPVVVTDITGTLDDIIKAPEPQATIPCPMCDYAWFTGCNNCNGTGKVPMPVLAESEIATPEPRKPTCKCASNQWECTVTITNEPPATEPRKPRECYRVMIGNQSYGTYSERGTAEDQLFDRTEIVHFREILPGEEDEAERLRQQLKDAFDRNRRLLDRSWAADETVQNLRADIAKLTAERDRLQRQLAIAVEFIQASDQADLQSYAEQHHIPLSAGWWTQSCARRCLELTAADAAREV